MKVVEECLVCGSRNLRTVDTVISEFVAARIHPDVSLGEIDRKTKLCFCEDCTFAFYDHRFTENEERLLYRGYRGDEYQKTREKYECWYTEKVNNVINRGGYKGATANHWEGTWQCASQ